MENTSTSENNIAIPDVIVVREATEQIKQDNTEREVQSIASISQENPQEEEDYQPRAVQKIGYWNGLYAIVILGICVACTSTITMIPQHNIFEYPEFWWEQIFLPGVFASLLRVALPVSWELRLVLVPIFLTQSFIR